MSGTFRRKVVFYLDCEGERSPQGLVRSLSVSVQPASIRMRVEDFDPGSDTTAVVHDAWYHSHQAVWNEGRVPLSDRAWIASVMHLLPYAPEDEASRSLYMVFHALVVVPSVDDPDHWFRAFLPKTSRYYVGCVLSSRAEMVREVMES